MSPYSFLISQMTWSYSRLKSFERCPYGFLMMYILGCESKSGFYAEYGTLIHDISSLYFEGRLKQEELLPEYLIRFYMEVTSPIDAETRKKFFAQGMDCMRRLRPSPVKVLGVEQEARFQIEGYPFVGYIDLLLEKPDGGLIVVDHKSHDLKARSKRSKPTKTDRELDDYLIQLYLYSRWVFEKFGRFPEKLVFHCYRTGTVVAEDFSRTAYDAAEEWALSLIHRIEQEEKFSPNLSWFACRHLCGVCSSCEYNSLGGF